MATVQKIDDRSMVLAAQEGDEAAINALLRSLSERLIPLASALCGGSGEADALVGDTISKVYERIRELRDPESITSWSRRVMVRKFIDQRRWFRRRPTVPIESVQVPTAMTTSAEQIDLRRAVERLGRRDRALLVLHYWQRLPISACAMELEIPEGTAKSRLNAALRRLRRELEEPHGT